MSKFNETFSINIQFVTEMMDFKETDNGLELMNHFDEFSYNPILTDLRTHKTIGSKYVGTEKEAMEVANKWYKLWLEHNDVDTFKQQLQNENH